MTERRPSIREAAAWLFGILLLSGGLIGLGFATASGIAPDVAGTSTTEFSNPRWVCSGIGLVVPLYFAARRHPHFKVLFAVAALIPQFVGVFAEMEMYAAIGEGEGMAGLLLLWPLLLTPIFLWVVLAADRRDNASDTAYE